jgi:uncharacterized membrane-anchored protein YitT (DUF2179 family)
MGAVYIMKKALKSYGIIALGSVIFALSFDWFFAPNQIGLGGLTGLAQVINVLLPWVSVGILVTVLNVPLFLLGWKLIGRHLLVSSLFSMLVCSAAIDGIALLYKFPAMDTMLACLVGGAAMGVGLGMVFSQGSTTGGTDVVARLLKLKFPWLPMGKLVLIPDFVVLALVAVVFGSVNAALYGLVALFISTVVIDKMLYGLDESKVAYIISDSWRKTADAILARERGVTILSAAGAYTGNEKHVLLVAFKQREIVEVKRIVHKIDPHAFLIVCNAHDVLGEGFGEYKKEDL